MRNLNFFCEVIKMALKNDFIWGTATSSFQIEGAVDEDGRKPSVWDYYSRTVPDVIRNNDRADVACDHYHRWEEDVQWLKKLGVKNYRLSVSWSRVLPDGTGRINKAGLYFYDRLVDALIENGITPWITLYHWDTPLALHYRGGWLNREIVGWFAEYAKVLVDRLSDRVSNWITINEPQCFLGNAFNNGVFAPFTKHPVCDQLLMAHNVLLAHGAAVDVIREHAKLQPNIGMAPTCWPKFPADENDPACIEAARNATFSVDPARVTCDAPWYLDAVYLGHYPEDGVRKLHRFMPEIKTGDMEQISRPLDFFGMNAYGGYPMDANGELVSVPAGAPRSAIFWWLNEQSLYWNARYMYDRYKQPIIFTENGFAGLDYLRDGDRIVDPERIDYIKRMVRQLNRITNDGIDLRGYFYWSLMDNFEWANGFSPRFGLLHVDYQTLERTPKQSFDFYRSVIESNGAVVLND